MSWALVFALHYTLKRPQWATQITVALCEISSDSTYIAQPFKKNGHILS